MKKILLLLMLCIGFLSYVNAQTETEPNNVWNQSNLTTLGGTGTGTTATGADEDWWRVSTPGDGKLTVNWTSVSGGYIYCQVYDTLGTIVLANAYTNGTSAHNIDGLAKGTYYIRFASYNSGEAVPYNFTATFTASPVANNTEPDSTIAQAKVLPLNGSVTGHIGYYFNNHRDSLDIYKVAVVADGSLSYTITSETGQYVYAQLFDGDGTSYFVGNYTNSSATYTKDGLAPGLYYIKIFCYSSNDFAAYTLSDALTAPASSNDPVANETPATASTLPLNGSVTGHTGYHYNGVRDDVDWWKVTVSADGRLDFSITSDNGQNLYAQLYDGDATTYLVGSYTTSTAGYSKDGLAPGVYYIKVFTYYTSEFTSYVLTNNLVQPTQANDAAPNDVYTSGTVLAVNGNTTGHIGYRYNGNIDSYDWYKLTTTQDGQISITITSVNGQNIYAELFDGDGVTNLTGSYTTSVSTYSKDGLAAGTYYIRVKTYYSSEFSPYLLSNTLTTIASPNDLEQNGTTATATVLSLNTTVTGHIGYHYNGNRDDSDFYAITLPVDGKLAYTITSQNGANVYARLVDHDGLTALSGSYTTGTATYSSNNLAAGTYYLTVYTYYTSEFSPYTLVNSFEPMTLAAEAAADNSIAAKGTVLPANTPTSGHINFYYNLQYDDVDWWKIGYDGTGAMALHIDIEQNHFDSQYPYINYALYLDTLGNPVSSGNYLNVPNSTINLQGLAVGIYYLKIMPYSSFGAYNLTASYTERCANVVAINSFTQLAGCNGKITYGISGGLPPYTVQLYKDGAVSGAPQVVDNTNTITYSNLNVGTYYLRSYSFGGSGSCNNVSGNTVFAIPATPTISAGNGSTTFCQGGSVTLTSSVATSYLWSTGATTQSIVVTTSGNYSVTAYNAAGCASLVSASTTVTVNPLPATPTIGASGVTTFCVGGSVTLTSSAATSYAWSTGATTQSIIVNASGSYSVIVKNANGCAATSAATTVTVNPLPATPTVTAGGPTTFCAGGGVTLTSSVATSYLWSNGSTTQSITANATGSYSVVVKNANGCSSATSASTTVTVNPLPTVTLTTFNSVCVTDGAFALTGGSPAGGTYSGTGVSGGQFNPATAGVGTFTITYSYSNANNCIATATQSITVTNCGGCTPTITAGGPTSFCQGGSVTLTSSAASSYSWSNGATTQSITVNTSGNYTVTTTSATGCIATSGATTVTVNPLQATPTITAGGPTSFCQGGSVTLTSSAAASYLWSNGATTQSITVNASGSFTVKATNAGGCSATSAATVVTVNPLPGVTLATFNSVCVTDGAFALTGGSPAGGTYTGTGVSGGQFSPATAGVGTFTITYSYSNANNCTATATQSITVTNCGGCTPTVTAGGPLSFCQGGSVTLTSSAAASYSWSNGATTQSITVNTSASYTVTTTSANGCIATSAATVVTVNPLQATPTITAGGPTSFCQGGSVTLTSSAASSYLWSNGATTQSITVNANGSFTVKATNAGGCTATSAATVVTVNPLPVVTLGQFSSVCSTAAAFALTGGSPAGGTYSGTGVSGGQFNPATAGVGTFIITYSNTNANNCTATATSSITVTNCTTCIANISADKPTTFCQGGSIELTASAGASFLWSTGATTQSITVNASGSYTVTITSANNCSATSSPVVVTVNPLPSVPTITANGSTSVCQGGSVTLTSSAATSYLWSNGVTTQSITASAAGSYSVTVKNASGCSRSSVATVIIVNPLPEIPVITAGGPTTFCQGESVTLTASAANSYLWSNGATTQSITVSSGGNYSVTVKNASGCSRTSAATTVTVNNCGGVYCAANGNSKNKGYIATVFLKNIYNTTGWSAGGYGNYLNQSASLNKKYNYLITVTPGYNSFIGASPLYTRVWIDWNQDGDFNDAGELVFAPSGASYFLRLGVVDVPNNALNGSTRMRVAMRADAAPTSCGSFNYGEVEDYTIIVGNGQWYRNVEPEEPVVTLNESFNLYPNPVSEELIIQRQSTDNSKVVPTSTSMQIADMNGKVLLSATLTRSTEVVDVRRLPAGVYLVRLRSGNAITTKKIIIAH